MNSNAITRSIRSSLIKIQIKIKEKKYNHLRYLFTSAKSEYLIVIFSGFAGGRKPVYNYINTLKSVNANKLFLLDEYGDTTNIGSYYLGENGDWFLVDDVLDIINQIKNDCSIKHIIMVGSSKGGSSALMYSLKMDCVDSVVIGAPQYYIGNYLMTKKHLPVLKAICGDESINSIERLNTLLPSLIQNSESKPIIYIHYSSEEHTYEEHVSPLIKDLRKHGYCVYEDSSYTYKDHKDVAKYFPQYLLHMIIKLIR